MKKHWLHLCLILTFIAGFNFQIVQADQGVMHILIPTGSDYRADTLERFAQAAAQRDTNGVVDLLVKFVDGQLRAYHTLESMPFALSKI